MSVNWQHPFVDVFKTFGVVEIASTQAKGQVTAVQDNSIGRKIIRLQGAISANNSFTIPDPYQGTKSLGLSGRYIYVEFLPMRGRYFTMHFEFLIKDREPPVKLTVSNMYDTNKVQQSQLLIPYPKGTADKWTILILDVEYFLSNFGLLPLSFYKTFKGIHLLKSFQICSSMNIRGIYTSDNLYDWETMPKQMLFKLPKGSKWSEEYQIAYWPTLDIQPQVQKQTLVDMTATIFDNLHQLQDNKEKLKNETQKSFKTNIQSTQQRAPQQLGDLVKRRTGEAAQSKSIEAMDHPLQPYPIQTLHKVIGFTVRTCPDIKWGRQNEQQKTVTYASGNLLLQTNINDNSQKFFLGHSQPISCLDSSKDGEWMVSGQSGKNAVVRIWRSNGDCLSAFATPYVDLINVSFSLDRKLLVTVGSDEHNREIIIVWGLENVEATRKPILKGKQTSSVNVLNIKFSPVDNNKIISCGHENIRFWRIKDGHLPGSSVTLNHHARNTTFTSFDFEYSYEEQNVANVYFGSKIGVLFQVNYNKQQLMQVFKVHNEPISAVCVSAGFCVTGSLDQFLRVWPLDFSEFYIEAKHEGVITSLDISLDGLQVACGTSTGGLGILDISSHHYKTIIRSHTGIIRQIQMHTFSGLLISLSEDCTIRLWDIEKQDQVYEFTFPVEDKCTVISGFPKGMFFAAGFKSGIHRIFDIENTSILIEGKYHDAEIQNLQYNPQGTYLVIADARSVYKIYDVVRNYQPIKTIQQTIPSQFNMGAFSQDGAILAIIEGSNNIDLWDSHSLQSILKIQSKYVIRTFKWAENNIELVCGFSDGRIVIYGLERTNDSITAYFLREQTFIHKQGLNGFAISPNMKYLITAGGEPYVKVWDYEFSIKGPGSCQVFIGHTQSINSVEICDKGETVITAGGDEGIFIWKFHGHIGKNERYINLDNYQQIQSAMQKSNIDIQHNQEDQGDISNNNEENIEQLDNYYDEDGENVNFGETVPQPEQQLVDQFPLSRPLAQLEDYEEQAIGTNQSPFKPDDFRPVRINQLFDSLAYDYERRLLTKSKSKSKLSKGIRQQYIQNHTRKATNLPYRQYILDSKSVKLSTSTLNGQYIAGYNNDSHDNVIWCRTQGWFAYSTQNYLIIEDLKLERKQTIIQFPTIISVLLLDKKENHILIGAANKLQDVAPIFIYSVETLKQTGILNFHTTGVHQMMFTEDGKYLITVGNAKECTIAVWDFNSKKLLSSSYTLEKINDIKISQFCFSKERIFEFTSVGRDQIYFWAFTKDNKLEYYDVFIPRNHEKQLEEATAVDYICFSGVQKSEANQSEQMSKSMGLGSQESKSVTVQTEDITLQEENRELISFLEVNQNKQQENNKDESSELKGLDKVIQCAIIGTQNGEIMIMKYGEFKVIFKRQVTKGEITSIRVNQAANKLYIMTTDNCIYFMDLSNIISYQSFLDSGFPFQRINLPAMVCGYSFEPLQQQGIIGLQDGTIYLLSISSKQIFPLAASNGDQAYDLNKPSTTKNIHPFQQTQITQAHIVEDTYIVVIHQGGAMRLWELKSAELITEYHWDKEISTFMYDGQAKQLLFFQEHGLVKTILLERLDLVDAYNLTQKQGPDTLISATFGLFDSVPGKFILDQSGVLYYYEQLYKNQEFIIRLNKALELPNAVEIVEQCDKKAMFVTHSQTGVVQTYIIDFNQGRQHHFGFTLYDQANFLDNPHGNLDNISTKQDTQTLYQDANTTTHVVGAKGYDYVYFAALDSLQYVYGRNYYKKQTILLITLSDFPLSINICDMGQGLRILVPTQNGQLELINPNDNTGTNIIHNSYLCGQIQHLITSRKRNKMVAMNQSLMNFIN